MAKITRYNGNLKSFASEQLTNERTLFGQTAISNDLTSQFTPEFLRGWGTVGPSDQPSLQDFNAAIYTNGQLLAYLHQMGIPEYNASQEYFIGSLTQTGGVLYMSKTNANIGNTPATSPTQWKYFTADIATQTVAGLVRLATSAEVTAGTNGTAAVTPLTLKDKGQTTPIDGSPGVFLLPGAFGLGGVSPTFPGNDLNNTAVNYGSTWGTVTGTINGPTGWNVQGSIVKVDVWISASVIQQTFLEHITGRTARRAFNGTVWSAWDTVYTSANIPTASEGAAGIIQIATSAEASAGTNDSKAITALKLASRLSGTLSNTLGYGKTYSDVTASRSSGTLYTNSTSAPIQVTVTIAGADGNADSATVVVGGVTVFSGDTGVSQQRTPITFVVPNGATYTVTVASTTITRWVELR